MLFSFIQAKKTCILDFVNNNEHFIHLGGSERTLNYNQL